MKTKIYSINDIFYSLQGEGAQFGTATIFIRFSGCNLKCDFCDTDFSGYSLFLLSDILNEIKKYPSKVISLCGGEPTLQVDKALIDALKKAGYYIRIETNGTNPILRGIDYVVISPKANIHESIKYADELRVIYPDKLHISHTGIICDNLYLSPCFDGSTPNYERIKQTVEYIKKNPQWKLSIQTHKLIGIE